MVHRYTCTLCMYVCMYVCMYDIHTWTVLMPHLGQKHGLLARPLGNWGLFQRLIYSIGTSESSNCPD